MSSPVVGPPTLSLSRDVLMAIASSVGTPTYVYSESVIAAQVERLRGLFDGSTFRMLYAMKANSCPAVLQSILSMGLGIDAVSPGEMLLALRLGFPPGDILYSPNYATDDELIRAHGLGARLNVGELETLRRTGRRLAGAEIFLRVNPLIGSGHHEYVVTAGPRSKFGIAPERVHEAFEIAESNGIRIVGLHQHIGSGILDGEIHARALRVLLDLALEIPDVTIVNAGGGLGVDYTHASSGMDLSRLADTVVEALAQFETTTGRGLQLLLEPGRFIVANAGILLVGVTDTKTTGERTFVGTDSGMNHLIRPAIYGAHHGISNLSNPDGRLVAYDVVGNICESSDFFARDRLVQETNRGDILAIVDTGAYGMSMASNYNLRSLPAEVFVHRTGEVSVARRRLEDDEMLDQLLASSTFKRHDV